MDGIVVENKPNIVIYGVDKEDGLWFQKVLKQYSGNAGKRLFKEMINRYNTVELLDALIERITELEERVEKLEGSEEPKKKVVKTMRGEYEQVGKVFGEE